MCDRDLRLCVLVLIALSAIQFPAFGQQGLATVSLKVSDLGDPRSPLPGVNVRILDAKKRQLASGPTDGLGVFSTMGVPLGQTIMIEYGLVGFVKNPERVTVVVDTRQKTIPGWLASDANSTEAYLRGIARTIEDLAGAESTPEARRASYEQGWSTVLQLPAARQRVVARRISDKQYLPAIPTFVAAADGAQLDASGQLTVFGELTGVDSRGNTLTVKTRDGGGLDFKYTDQTKVSGAQRGVAGLSTMGGASVVARYTIRGTDRVLVSVEIGGNP
jgi:hypothetical protein